MLIPTQYLSVNTNKIKPTKRAAVVLEQADSNPDTTKQTINTHVVSHDKREGAERRKKQVKTLLDTRTGRDRRYNKQKPAIDIKA